jgi:ATP:ADP antiporter, AAA family
MPFRRLRAKLLPPLQPGELRGAVWSFLYFFCVLTAYYILRPVREARGVGVGVQWLPALYAGSFLTLLLVTPLWGALLARVPRGRLLPWSYRCFALVLVAFFLLFRRSGHWLPASGFFLWMSTFNLLAVAIFWAFMTDVWPAEAGKRLFGLIAAGGSAGAVVGPAVTVALVTRIGPEVLLLLAAALLEAAVFCLRRVSRWAAARPVVNAGAADAGPASARDDEQTVGGGVWAGLTALARSPFLAAAAGFTLLGTLSATFNHNLQARLVSERGQGQAIMTQLFASIDLATNILTALLQALVAAPLLTRFGVAPALAALPLISGAGFTAAAVAPVLAVVAAMTVFRRSTAYGLVTPAYGVLFSQASVSREQKYKARTAIDTVIFRTGDLVGSLAFSGLLALGLGLRGTALISAAVAIPWLILGWWLQRQNPGGHG